MKRWTHLLVAAAALSVGACTSGGGPSCSFDGGTQLAATAWPAFRADTANSGRAPDVDLTATTGSGSVIFDGRCSIQSQITCRGLGTTPTQCQTPPNQTCVLVGAVSATPILGSQSIFLASSDGNVYIVDYSGQPVVLPNQIFLSGVIAGSPLLGADGTLFVPGNSRLVQFFADGTIRNSASLGGFVSASPTIWGGANGIVDGTVFVGTQSGAFTAVCPNGVNRFSVIFPETQSTAALVADPSKPPPTPQTPIIIAGGLAGQVRAYNVRGRQFWSFFASATIVASVLIDPTTDLFYVADSAGHVFAADVATGQLDSGFTFPAAQAPIVPITASPALSRDETNEMYVADQSGTLYALDRTSGTVLWTFKADGPISASPAVATGGTNDVIVLAADILGVVDPNAAPVPVSGKVYAIRDDGTRGTVLWTFDTGHVIGASSPAIASDGTVYIGRQGARLGSDGDCSAQDLASPCLVNDGGALYAIAP